MSFLEAARTTLVEFEIYNLAYAIQQEDKRYNAAIQAWMNQRVQATKGSGKSVRSAFKTFDDFYNRKEEFERIFRTESKENKKGLTMADRNRRLNHDEKGGL
jgi:hypothetical protein|nr:MAG TPA: LSM domain [Caudoviricetes sp.]